MAPGSASTSTPMLRRFVATLRPGMTVYDDDPREFIAAARLAASPACQHPGRPSCVTLHHTPQAEGERLHHHSAAGVEVNVPAAIAVPTMPNVASAYVPVEESRSARCAVSRLVQLRAPCRISLSDHPGVEWSFQP